VGKDAVPALMEIVKDNSEQGGPARIKAIDALRAIGPEAKGALRLLVDTLRDTEGLQWAAVSALGAIGPEARPAVEPLLKLLEGSIRMFQPNAPLFPSRILEAIGKIDPYSKSWLPDQFRQIENDLIRALQDPANNARAAEQLRAHWQGAYEALKKKYEKSK